MALMVRKIMENKRRQHALVTAHKRRIRDEVIPHLRETKRNWFEASNLHKLKIRKKWHTQKTRVQGQQREQYIKHRNSIATHKRRIKAELARRR